MMRVSDQGILEIDSGAIGSCQSYGRMTRLSWLESAAPNQLSSVESSGTIHSLAYDYTSAHGECTDPAKDRRSRARGQQYTDTSPTLDALATLHSPRHHF